MRIRGKVDCDAVTGWRAYLDPALRVDYDRNIQSAKTTKILGANLAQVVQTTNPVLTVSSRDLHQVIWSNILEDGTVKLVAYDLPDEPAVEGNVRMRVPVAGLTLIPDLDDPRKCELL